MNPNGIDRSRFLKHAIHFDFYTMPDRDDSVRNFSVEENLLASPLVKHNLSDGLSQYEIRMPSDHVAILIRKTK